MKSMKKRIKYSNSIDSPLYKDFAEEQEHEEFMKYHRPNHLTTYPRNNIELWPYLDVSDETEITEKEWRTNLTDIEKQLKGVGLNMEKVYAQVFLWDVCLQYYEYKYGVRERLDKQKKNVKEDVALLKVLSKNKRLRGFINKTAIQKVNARFEENDAWDGFWGLWEDSLPLSAKLKGMQKHFIHKKKTSNKIFTPMIREMYSLLTERGMSSNKADILLYRIMNLFYPLYFVLNDDGGSFIRARRNYKPVCKHRKHVCKKPRK